MSSVDCETATPFVEDFGGASDSCQFSVQAVPLDGGSITFVTDGETCPAFRFWPPSPTREERRRFEGLADEWKRETEHVSRVGDMTSHHAYRDIVSMGEVAVPLLLQELQRDPDLWFWALTEITGTNPIEPQHQGDITAMALDWLTWGRANGYEW